MVNYIWENIFKNSSKESNIESSLKENFLFSSLSKKELNFVEKIIHVRQYHPSELIFRQGEIGVGMYIIVKGSVDIYQEKDEDEDNENRVHITRLYEGTFFGELSLVEENGKRSATASAHDETTLIGFFKPDLLEILDRNPTTGVKIIFKLAQILGQRLRATTDKVSQLRNHIRNSDSDKGSTFS